VSPSPAPGLFYDTVNVGPLPGPAELTLELPVGTRARAVGVESHSLTTRRREVRIGDPDADVSFAAVVERHRASGRVGRGLATGFTLKRGAIASTVAHDAHNIVVIGAGGADMARAVAEIVAYGGGQVAVLDGEVIGAVPLPLAGLMSDRPAAEVAAQIGELNQAIHARLGVSVDEPFMQLSFIALSVIPELRLTDGGLFDVDRFAHVPVAIEGGWG
jgi:adenine deaminase